jgi:hypothetical protein
MKMQMKVTNYKRYEDESGHEWYVVYKKNEIVDDNDYYVFKIVVKDLVITKIKELPKYIIDADSGLTDPKLIPWWSYELNLIEQLTRAKLPKRAKLILPIIIPSQ